VRSERQNTLDVEMQMAKLIETAVGQTRGGQTGYGGIPGLTVLRLTDVFTS
jgi:hypothetical protein